MATQTCCYDAAVCQPGLPEPGDGDGRRQRGDSRNPGQPTVLADPGPWYTYKLVE